MFVRISLIFPTPELAPWEIPITTARDQLNIIGAVALVGVYAKEVPLHIAEGVRVLVKVGVGLTLTVTF